MLGRMTRADLVALLREYRVCVQASVSASGAPQAAIVGFAVTDDLEIVFDTLETTRKAMNLRRDPRISLVIGGWGPEERTVQIDGVADEPQGPELQRLKAAYFAVYPDGVERQRWEGITYVRVRPTWVRHSHFRVGGAPSIVEMTF
jgi:pyridoxine/pyridoxamine 5'-phosphate oxidase